MAVKELLRQQGLNPRKVKILATGISGASASVKQITTMEMPAEELESAMPFEARKHIPMDGTDAVIDYQIMGSNEKEVDKIDVGLVAYTKGVLNSHVDLLKECGLKPGVIDVDPIAVTNAFTFLRVLGPIAPSADAPTNFCKYFAALPVPAFTPKSKTQRSRPDGSWSPFTRFQ